MNPSPSHFPPEVEEQASLWAARIDGSDLSDEQCTELDHWLTAAPDHRMALSAYCQLSADLEARLPGLIRETSVSNETETQTSRVWWWSAIGLAAAACLALVFSTLLPDSDGARQVATAIAERQSVTFSDGTQVDLNADTNLVFLDTSHERRARLASGQAFFVVAKDADRPFIVDTPMGSVRVTGTAFDVRNLTSGDFAVTVAEGSVEVRLGESNDLSASAPFQLHQRDRLHITQGEARVESLTDIELSRELAWRTGQLLLDNAALSQVLDQFSHFHGIGISAPSQVSDLKLSGQFTLADLDDFLLVLETVHPVRVIRDQSGTIRVVARE